MKHLKKIMSLILTAIMVIAMCVPVMAATVTIDGTSEGGVLQNHTFAAYQIFSGDQSTENNEVVLSNIAWGSGIDGDKFLNELKGDTTYGSKFTNASTVDSLAKVLGANVNDSAFAKFVAKTAYKNKKGDGTSIVAGSANNLSAGYYLIVDTTTLSDGQAANSALLQVVGDVRIQVKTDVPKVEKKVRENTKYANDDGYGSGYNDVADYNIGDMVSFHLIGTVPDMSAYETYYYQFKDTLGTQFDMPDTQNIKVYFSKDKTVDIDTVADADEDVTDNFDITVDSDNHIFYVTAKNDDIKAWAKNDPSKSYIIVEYSAKLNTSAAIGQPGQENKVDLTYTNNPDTNGHGKTKEDKVIVFTYELDTKKIGDGDANKTLAGAEFKLKNADGKWVKVDNNSKVEGWFDNEVDGSTLTSDSDGIFKIIGLDSGNYTLKETKAPSGYNLPSSPANEFAVELTAKTANGQNWSEVAAHAYTDLSVKLNNQLGTVDSSKGTATVTVSNEKGSTLPETGGIGTTIFYVVGVVLMLGAGVLLITKRRMSAKH